MTSALKAFRWEIFRKHNPVLAAPMRFRESVCIHTLTSASISKMLKHLLYHLQMLQRRQHAENCFQQSRLHHNFLVIHTTRDVQAPQTQAASIWARLQQIPQLSHCMGYTGCGYSLLVRSSLAYPAANGCKFHYYWKEQKKRFEVEWIETGGSSYIAWRWPDSVCI